MNIIATITAVYYNIYSGFNIVHFLEVFYGCTFDKRRGV